MDHNDDKIQGRIIKFKILCLHFLHCINLKSIFFLNLPFYCYNQCLYKDNRIVLIIVSTKSDLCSLYIVLWSYPRRSSPSRHKKIKNTNTQIVSLQIKQFFVYQRNIIIQNDIGQCVSLFLQKMNIQKFNQDYMINNGL